MSTTPGPRISRPPADDDIYTVLLVIAFVALLAAVIYVAFRAYTALGGLLPPGGLT